MSTIGFAVIVGAVVGMCVSAIVLAILTRDCEPCGYSDFTTTTTTTTTTANTGPDDDTWFWKGDACERTNRDGIRSGGISERFWTGFVGVWKSGAIRIAKAWT